MKLKLTFIVLIVSVVSSAIAENTTSSLTGSPNVTAKPKSTTTTPPNFISSTLDNIRKFFFSEFFIFFIWRVGGFTLVTNVLRLSPLMPFKLIQLWSLVGCF